MEEREAARPEKLNRKDHQVEPGVGKICQAPISAERERVSFPFFFFFFPGFVGRFSPYLPSPIRRRILSTVYQSETGTRPSETELPRARARACKLQQEGTIARPCVKNEDIQMEI